MEYVDRRAVSSSQSRISDIDSASMRNSLPLNVFGTGGAGIACAAVNHHTLSAGTIPYLCQTMLVFLISFKTLLLLLLLVKKQNDKTK